MAFFSPICLEFKILLLICLVFGYDFERFHIAIQRPFKYVSFDGSDIT